MVTPSVRVDDGDVAILHYASAWGRIPLRKSRGLAAACLFLAGCLLSVASPPALAGMAQSKTVQTAMPPAATQSQLHMQAPASMPESKRPEPNSTHATVSAPLLHVLFQDHAVLQRDQPIRVWGHAAPSEQVRVQLAGKQAKARADAQGDWELHLPALPAGGPYTLTASNGDREQTIGDLLIGDVWLCSGQSNMELPVWRTLDASSEISGAHDERIRLMTVPQRGSVTASSDLGVDTHWSAVTPESVREFSAACYYFARELRKTVDVPMGLIDASWGGSRIQAWMSADALRHVGGYQDELAVLDRYADDPIGAVGDWGQLWQRWWSSQAGVAADDTPWTSSSAGSSDWKVAPAQLGAWEHWGVPALADFNGMLWYRAQLHLSAAQAAQAAVLVLGPADEIDMSWLNGRAVGSTYGAGDERQYPLPPGLLHEGDNVVVVNVLDTWREGGLAGPASRHAVRLADGTSVPLTQWRYRPMPASFASPPRAPWQTAGGLSTLYNGMIAPLGAYGLRGVLWYQGESNTGEAARYADLLRALRSDWRQRLGADLPWLIVQLAGFGMPPTHTGESDWAALREAQRRVAAEDPRSGLAVAVDIGDRYDIHPGNKQELGRRLARAARHVVYGDSVSASGPVPSATRRDGASVVVDFADVEGGLLAYGTDGPVGFQLCGDDAGSCRYSVARGVGNSVFLDGADDASTASGDAATRVRYCWADNPVCTLYDASGLPAGPFEAVLPSTKKANQTMDAQAQPQQHARSTRIPTPTAGATAPTASMDLTSPAPRATPSGVESNEVAQFDWFEYTGQDAVFDTPLPPGHYRNPILAGFHADPSITRVGDHYYLVNSSFTFYPGIPVSESTDLVNWKVIGHVLDRPSLVDFDGLSLSRGIFAPTISHHDDRYYVVTTAVDSGGNFVSTARNPAGPWSDPVWLPGVEGIDPSLFFDDDGRTYLLNNDAPVGTPRYDGHRAIWMQEFDLQALKPIGPRRVLLDGGVDPAANPIWIEGPHLLKREGWYYLVCAEGGTGPQHSQVVLRSRSPWGPFTPYAHNPILTQRDLPEDRVHPITNAGHADLVQTPSGDWWAVFLASRNYDRVHYNTGRETFLLPVTWRDGWPEILEAGKPIPYIVRAPAIVGAAVNNDASAGGSAKRNTNTNTNTGNFRWRDEFDQDSLDRAWYYVRIPKQAWVDTRARPGWLTLHAGEQGLDSLGNPHFLARWQQHTRFQASTQMAWPTAKVEAGLAALQNEKYWYALGVRHTSDGAEVYLERCRDGVREVIARQTVAASVIARQANLRLLIAADGGRYDFGFDAGEGVQWLGRGEDGSLLSTDVAGGFVGASIGPFAQLRGATSSVPARVP